MEFRAAVLCRNSEGLLSLTPWGTNRTRPPAETSGRNGMRKPQSGGSGRKSYCMKNSNFILNNKAGGWGW